MFSPTYRKIPALLQCCQRLILLHRKYDKKRPRMNTAILSKLLGFNSATSKQIVKEHPELRLYNTEQAQKCAAILMGAGYSSEYVRKHLSLLSLPPIFLKNCLFLCQEYACYSNQIGPAILDFNRFMNLRISVLKEFKIIPSGVIVLDSLLLYLNIPKSECDLKIDDLKTVKEVYWNFFDFYLKRELQTDDKNLKKLKTKADCLVSFRLLRENLYLLKKSFGFTNEQLLQMPYLLRTDSENTISILRSARGVNLKEMIISHPRLLTVPSENIRDINKLLKENGMDFTLLLNDPELLRMDIDKLMYRLIKLISSPSLTVFKDHPRVCELLRQTGIASERMLILKEHDLNCYDLNVLTGHPNTFHRHITGGIDKSESNDAAIIISRKLELPIKKVKRELNKNRGLKYVQLKTVTSNIEFLLELGFTKDDIYRSVQILLYPSHIIAKNLNDVLMNPVVVSESVEFQVLKRKYFLPLTLYYIEKKFRFTESGVFCNNNDENSSDKILLIS